MDHGSHPLGEGSGLIDPSGSLTQSECIGGVPNAQQDEKLHAIWGACKLKDLDALVALATSPYGLIQDEARREACELA